jgi:hypothetical protein
MPEINQNPSPVMSRGARLNPNQTGWQVIEKADDLRSPELPPQNSIALLIDAVDLKNVLGDILADCDNFLHGRFSRL